MVAGLFSPLMVAFKIEQSTLRIPRDTRAKIVSSDFFGTKAIDLIAGEDEMLAEPGDTLLSDLEMGIAEAVRIELLPLKNKTDQLIDGVDDILENLKAVFEADATLGLPTAFESIQRTVESLEKTSIQLDNMVLCPVIVSTSSLLLHLLKAKLISYINGMYLWVSGSFKT